MASYNYSSRGYMPQESTIGPRYDAWEAPNNGIERHSQGWGKTGFANSGEGYRDHVCRPVLIDAQGRKIPLIACDANHNMEGFVTQTETFVEKVHVPQVTSRYGISSPTEMGRTRDYGVLNSRWNRPVSPSRDRPPIVDEFISAVQTEASRPIRTNLVSSTNWSQTPNSSGGYGVHSDNGSNIWNKPRDPYFDIPLGRNHTAPNGNHEPTMLATNGWTRPTHVGWATPPSNNNPLSKPTNDIGAAIDYLKEATNPTSVTMAPLHRFTVPTPMVPKLERSATIDSREARKKYGSFSAAPQAIKTADISSGIDSREAARKYNGQIL